MSIIFTQQFQLDTCRVGQDRFARKDMRKSRRSAQYDRHDVVSATRAALGKGPTADPGGSLTEIMIYGLKQNEKQNIKALRLALRLLNRDQSELVRRESAQDRARHAAARIVEIRFTLRANVQAEKN
jgi:hypothetical protein